MAAPGQVTQLLAEMRNGNPEAANNLMPIVYNELRRVAANLMQRERPGHTLQPTAVVHEAYMRLADSGELTPENRPHFFAIAARAMRQVLVDHARRKFAAKRGGELQQRVEMDENLALTEQESIEFLALHEALELLKSADERQAQILEMHYFGGNSVEEIGTAMGIGDRTVKRDLQTGRLFLKDQLEAKRIRMP